MAVGVHPRKVFRVRIWSALKCFWCLKNIDCQIFILLCSVSWILVFQKSEEARIRTTLFGSRVQRSESLKELSMTMSRIVFLEVH